MLHATVKPHSAPSSYVVFLEKQKAGTCQISDALGWYRAVLASGQMSATCAVASVYFEKMDKGGVSWPPVGYIMESLRMCRRHVQEQVRVLVEAGWLCPLDVDERDAHLCWRGVREKFNPRRMARMMRMVAPSDDAFMLRIASAYVVAGGSVD
jgi:hypothetical protein